MDEKYSLFTHRHNFAIWAAARASQRGLKGASVSTLKAALEASGLPDAIQDASKWPRSADHFDSFHRRHCNRIADHLGNAGVANVSYGRVAKLVAIYIKSMVVVSEHARSTFAAIIHPPIDRSLLQEHGKRSEVWSAPPKLLP